MTETTEIANPPALEFANLIITVDGKTVDFPDRIQKDLPHGEIRRMAAEAVAGGIPGLEAQEVDFSGYIVDPVEAAEGMPDRILLRPKTAFGSESDDELKFLFALEHNIKLNKSQAIALHAELGKWINNQDGFKDSMSIWTPSGSPIKYTGENGLAHDREHAENYLDVGQVYTVAYTNVEQSRSQVYLYQFPEIAFNTVHFSNESTFTEEQEKSHPQFKQWRE